MVGLRTELWAPAIAILEKYLGLLQDFLMWGGLSSPPIREKFREPNNPDKDLDRCGSLRSPASYEISVSLWESAGVKAHANPADETNTSENGPFSDFPPNTITQFTVSNEIS